MKEVLAIIEAFGQAQPDSTTALATIIEVRGSTYRRSGARMLITSTGDRIGSISGGCLEADICDRAGAVIASGQPLVLEYDTTSDSEIIWGYGMGCKGMVRVLVEPLTPENPLNPIAFISDCYRSQQIGVLATVCHVESEAQEQVGNWLMLQQNGKLTSNLKNSALSASLLKDVWETLSDRHSKLNSYILPNGQVEVFIDVIQPPVPLIVFGAGGDVIPVVRLAKELGWYVTVVNLRHDTTGDRFFLADEVKFARPEKVRECLQIGDRTVVVVMTHNYLHDLELLKTLLASEAKYIGVLGARQRTQQLLQDLAAWGMQPSTEQLHRLHSPIGLDIGADTPEAIALSIVAEIQAFLANRAGGFLKNRSSPIHTRIA